MRLWHRARWFAGCAAAVAMLTAGATVSGAAEATAGGEVGAASGGGPCLVVVAAGMGSAPIAQVDIATGEVLFLHGDSIGSTRTVTDASGAVVAEFDYSLYGTVSTVSGDADATRFLFAGEYLDPSGDYYLRNRVYDPASASFLTVDPVLAATGMPYAYTAGNPLQAVDPLGLNWLSDTLTSPAFWASTVVFLGCELATGGTGSVLCLAGAGAVYGAVNYVETTPAECQTVKGFFIHTVVGAVEGVVGGRVFGPVISKALGAGGRGLLKIAPTFVRETLGGVAEAASARLSAFTEAVQQRTGNLFAQARAALADDTGSIQIGGSVNSGTAFTRFTVDSAGETTLNLRLGSGSVRVSPHAAERMAQKGVSIDGAEAALSQHPFPYFHDGAWKTGYYDPTARVLVGTINGEVTTVIPNASSNYISNLQAVVP